MGAQGGGTIGKGLTELSTRELSTPAPREGTRSLIAPEGMGVLSSSDDEAGLHCLSCGREGDFAAICQRCAGRMKASLLDEVKRTMSDHRSGRQFYCLHCHKLSPTKHEAHQGMAIPLGWYEGKRVAWASGEESWVLIFSKIKIQSTKRDRPVRPYTLHKADAVRCDTCFDIMTTERLYGPINMSFCSLKCWVAGGRGNEAAAEVILTEAVIAMDFTNQPNAFCLTCMISFQRPGDDTHRGHDCLSVRSDSDGCRPRVVIPAGHPLGQVWSLVSKRKEGTSNEVLIRDDWSLRCMGCSTRLGDVGDTTCCLECSLDWRTRLVPRPLQLRKLNN